VGTVDRASPLWLPKTPNALLLYHIQPASERCRQVRSPDLPLLLLIHGLLSISREMFFIADLEHLAVDRLLRGSAPAPLARKPSHISPASGTRRRITRPRVSLLVEKIKCCVTESASLVSRSGTQHWVTPDLGGKTKRCTYRAPIERSTCKLGHHERAGASIATYPLDLTV